jgi:NADH dehydrogenase [ubiquinone] 1 alpha subcomplex assembly factor 6
MNKSVRFCQDMLRKSDHDYWLMGLLLPQRARGGFYAIRAFNVETATIIDSARGKVLPAQVRLQWWRDNMQKIYDGGDVQSGSPVLASLADAVRTHGLSRRWFDRVIEARERDLTDGQHQPASMADLERYCSDTATSMVLLSLECLRPSTQQQQQQQQQPSVGGEPSIDWLTEVAEDLAAQHVGQAVGLCTLLRGTAFHAARGDLYLPEDLLQRHGARARSFLEDPAAAPLEDGQRDSCRGAVREVAELAGQHLDAASALCDGRLPTGGSMVSSAGPPVASTGDGGDGKARGSKYYGGYAHSSALTSAIRAGGRVPQETMAAFLPAVRSRSYLSALAECSYDLHHPRLWPFPAYEHEGSGRLGFQFRLFGSVWGIRSPLK